MTQRPPATWLCLLKSWPTRWIAGAMSGETATLSTRGRSLQLVRAMTAWAVSPAMRTAEIATAIATSSPTLTWRSRPRRLTRPRRAREVTGFLGLQASGRPGAGPSRPGPRLTISEGRRRIGRLAPISRRAPGGRRAGGCGRQVGGGQVGAGGGPGVGSATLRGMSTMVPVGDAGDPRLADYVRLTDVHLRRSLEAPSGLFVAEGEKVIRRAIGAGYPVRSLLITRDKLAVHADLAGSCPGPVYLVEPEVAEQVTGYRVHRGALASMQRLPLPSVTDVTGNARRLVVLEDIVDHTNVGAIFRCVAALGFDAVVLAPRCADPLYRRSVRVSMGAVFAVPYARMADWREGLGGLSSAGFRLLALTPAPDAVPIGDVPAGPGDRLALLLGTEGDGLSARWRDQADVPVRIPMRRGVDSLNVASAAAIACYLLAERVP